MMAYRIYDVTASDELASVGNLQMPAVFTLHLFDHDNGAPNINLTWQVRNGAPECIDVHIERAEGGHEIRVSGLAGIRIEDCLGLAVKLMLSLRDDRSDEPGPTNRAIAAWLEPATLTTAGEIETARFWFDFDRGRDAVAQTEAARAGRKVKITDALLREVADIYRANVSDKPTEAVAEHFDKGHRTAALYVKRARERGFLGPAIKGKAGEQ
jgi:hypothetical protein